MNVEKICALEQVKSMLTNAYQIAEKQLLDPCCDAMSVSSFLLTRIQIVQNEINGFIKEEEDSLEAYYEQWVEEQSKLQKEASGNLLLEHAASTIRKAFGDCWMQVRQTKSKFRDAECEISIQPDNYTPNDIQLVLRSLGYTSTFEAVSEGEHAKWAYFEVQRDGLVFKLSTTVSAIELPDIERYDEPASDVELISV